MTNFSNELDKGVSLAGVTVAVKLLPNSLRLIDAVENRNYISSFCKALSLNTSIESSFFTSTNDVQILLWGIDFPTYPTELSMEHISQRIKER